MRRVGILLYLKSNENDIPGTSCLLWISTRTGRGDERMDGGDKGKYSYGNVIPSYWVLQAQDTHAGIQHTLGENRETKQNKKKVMF